MDIFRFKIDYKDKRTKARVGEIATPHGVIKTPAFVPVGTQGSVKSLTPDELTDLDVQLFIVNTYHVYLRPGIEVVKKFGGLHKFIGWDKPLITDSGGFQVFSLGRNKSTNRHSGHDPESIEEVTKHGSRLVGRDDSKSMVQISEDGVEFQSHWDGSKHLFTPESSMQNQWDLGSDIHIAFDDCTPYPATHDQAKKSMERTHRWAERSLAEHERLRHSEPFGRIQGKLREESLANASSNKLRDPSTTLEMTKLYQALYGVIQGSVFEDLRKESAKFITSVDFDGIAIGGVSVGESKKEMVNVLKWVTPLLPDDKPRHLLGVGQIDDIFALVEYGMDTFDCVQPTRLARVGRVYINTTNTTNTTNNTNGKWEMDITKKEFAEDVKPIDDWCQCYTCQRFSRAYLHHLFRVRELLAYRLATLHNIYFVNTLMSTIRKSIVDNTFLELKEKWLYNNFKL